MRSIVKVVWKEGSTPRLKLASEEGFEYLTLSEGRELDLEVIDERRCTGFHVSRGEHVPCPEFRQIDSGDQCGECRGKDFYSDYRRGKSGDGLEADFSVYLAQCGPDIKVGVTRGSRLRRRWLEQGADYGAEIFSGLSANEALEKESDLSANGLKERIRKDRKNGFDGEKLSSKLEEMGIDTDVQQISEPLRCRRIDRKGRFPSPIEQVKGQIVSDGSIGLALTSGKCVIKAEQQSLGEF